MGATGDLTSSDGHRRDGAPTSRTPNLLLHHKDIRTWCFIEKEALAGYDLLLNNARVNLVELREKPLTQAVSRTLR